MNSEPSDNQETQTTLEVVEDAPETAPEAPVSAEPESAGGRGGGLRKVFWIAAFAVILLAVAALGTTGYLGQRELRERVSALEGELSTAEQALALERSALAGERARADGLQTTMGRVNELSNQLAASLQELQALTGSATPAEAAVDLEETPALEADAAIEILPTDEAGSAEDEAEAAAEIETGAVEEANPVEVTALPDLGAANQEAAGPSSSDPPQTQAPTASEFTLSDDAAPSILETSDPFSDVAVSSEEISAALSKVAADEDAQAAAAVGGTLPDSPLGEALPPISAEADLPEADRIAEEDDPGLGSEDESEATAPQPLWEQAVDRLRALAPSE